MVWRSKRKRYAPHACNINKRFKCSAVLFVCFLTSALWSLDNGTCTLDSSHVVIDRCMWCRCVGTCGIRIISVFGVGHATDWSYWWCWWRFTYGLLVSTFSLQHIFIASYEQLCFSFQISCSIGACIITSLSFAPCCASACSTVWAAKETEPFSWKPCVLLYRSWCTHVLMAYIHCVWGVHCAMMAYFCCHQLEANISPLYLLSSVFVMGACFPLRYVLANCI